MPPIPPGPSPDGGGSGGGGFTTPPFLTIQPTSPKNLGNIPAFDSTAFVLTALNSGSFDLTITSIGFSDPEISCTDTLPITVPSGHSVNINFQVTPSAVGISHGLTLTFNSSASNPQVFYVVVWDAVDSTAGGIITVTTGGDQPLGVFPDTKINQTSDASVDISNTGTAAFNILTLTVTSTEGSEFTLPSPPTLPYLLNPGDFVNVGMEFTPDELGNEIGNLHITTDLTAPQNSVNVGLSGLSVPLFPVSILSNGDRVILISFDDGEIKWLEPNSWNYADGDSLGVFNGALWDSPGQEKSLERILFYYENMGVCEGLQFQLSVLRPSIGEDYFQVVSAPVTIGTALADGTERSAYADLTASGELAFLSIVRTRNTGPCSITAIVPVFASRGEKVENE